MHFLYGARRRRSVFKKPLDSPNEAVFLARHLCSRSQFSIGLFAWSRTGICNGTSLSTKYFLPGPCFGLGDVPLSVTSVWFLCSMLEWFAGALMCWTVPNDFEVVEMSVRARGGAHPVVFVHNPDCTAVLKLRRSRQEWWQRRVTETKSIRVPVKSQSSLSYLPKQITDLRCAVTVFILEPGFL